jgi:hypothetical protein
MDRDPWSRTRGGVMIGSKCRDPKPTMMLLSAALAAFLNQDSRCQGDARITESAVLALEYAARVQNADGTFHLTPVNFRSPPGTAFIVSRMVVACDLMSLEGAFGTPGGLRDPILLARMGLDTMTIGPFFAEHHDTVGAYSDPERGRELFTACATAFTPVRRSLAFNRSSWFGTKAGVRGA